MTAPTPIKTSGSVMMIVIWVAVLAGMVTFFGYLLDKIYNPNQHLVGRIDSSGSREVTLIRSHSGHYVTSGAINGHPVVFLLDTGATDVSIPKPVADRLKLKKGIAINAHTANGAITVHTTRLHTVSVGNVTLQNITANINPYMAGEEILLGMSFLKHLELVQRGKTLTLRIPRGL